MRVLTTTVLVLSSHFPRSIREAIMNFRSAILVLWHELRYTDFEEVRHISETRIDGLSAVPLGVSKVLFIMLNNRRARSPNRLVFRTSAGVR
jgi:hypothetical protein